MNDLDLYCAACGTPLVPGAAFCYRCGSRVPAMEEPSAAPPPGPTEPSAEPHAGSPEAAGSLPPEGAAPPIAPPSGGAFLPPPIEPQVAAPVDEGLARALAGSYPLRVSEWLSRGWNVFTRGGGFFIGFAAIAWILSAITVTVHVTWPLLLLAAPLIWSGFMTGALVTRRGERVQFADFFLPFHDFVPLLLAFLVWMALLFAGLCSCGVVTVYLFVGYLFACPLILDRRMDFWDALETSRKVVTKEWLRLSGFALLLLLINFAGLMVVTFGLIVTIPLTVCALVEAYADIFGVRGGLPGPTTPAAAPGTNPSV